MRAALFATLAAIALISGPAGAKDLGTYGKTFPIRETDLLEHLKRKLMAAKESGRIDQLNQAFAARAKRSIERPPPVAGLVATVTPRSFLFDPSIIVPQDYADHDGRVFARAGERINPLQRLPEFKTILVFIDGDDPRQVAFGLARLRKEGAERVRLILVKGAPLELMRKVKTPLYFDQHGRLASHFGLRQIPAIVAREGDRLRVSEVRP